MIVRTVPFVPNFILGGIYLFVPGLLLTLFLNSEPPGAILVALTALAALIRPQANPMLFCVLCSLRTVPFLIAGAMAVGMRIGLAQQGWPAFFFFIAIGAVAHARIHFLRVRRQIVI
ncbi:hypothetical protein [Sphingobium sp. CFD-2]|uniref:hypothetical protein n=1 Tax=Sphingobium sp. CFD-2 TaxID=2878542 RepID=UPI00214C9928|nr:hypothetical protein [Sphingobium sp. CFD-2]